jgi:hypothetical protein
VVAAAAAATERSFQVEWIVVILLIVLLLGAFGPRAGWYGTANVVWDILGLILILFLVYWLLRVLGVLV